MIILSIDLLSKFNAFAFLHIVFESQNHLFIWVILQPSIYFLLYVSVEDITQCHFYLFLYYSCTKN